MSKDITVIFVEDYKNMSKEEFSEYIKQIYQQGYDKGYNEGFTFGSCSLTTPNYYGNTNVNIKEYGTGCLDTEFPHAEK